MMIRMILYLCLTPTLLAQTDLWISTSNHIGNNGNRVFVNGGLGLFSDTDQTLGKHQSKAIAFGDVDGDGDLDVLDGTFKGCVVFLNNGFGEFTYAYDFGADVPEVRSVALADIDLDGDLDALLGVHERGSNLNSQVYKNDGTGWFTYSSSFGSNHTNSIGVADLNGDAYPDIFETTDVDADRVWFNDGSGSFIDSGQLFAPTIGTAVALADVEGDGDLDVLIVYEKASPQLLVNDGTGQFTLSQVLTLVNASTAVFADLDADGDQDILVGSVNPAKPLQTWQNDGHGHFVEKEQTLAGFAVTAMCLGDIDGDGDLDLYLGQPMEDKIFSNDGTGQFSETVQTLPRTYSAAGALVYLRLPFSEAIARWQREFTIQSLLRFQAQLQVETDFRRGR